MRKISMLKGDMGVFFISIAAYGNHLNQHTVLLTSMDKTVEAIDNVEEFLNFMHDK